MSYILDALRRLEQDKERTKRGANPMEAVLLPDVEEAERAERGHRWWVGIGVILLALVIGATYWAARRTLVVPTEPATEKAVPHLSSAPPEYDRSAPRSDPRSASSALQPPTSEPERAASFSADAASSSRGAPPSAPPLGRPAAVGDSSLPAEAEEMSRPVVSAGEDALPTRQQEIPLSPDVPEDEGVQEWRGSEIKINAIAYSLDDKSRFAVVNLKTVHEGDELEGLAVVAIQENGIVFEREGTQYRVSLGKR